MKKMRNTKSILLLTLVVIIALGSVGGTLAYLITTDGPIENLFNPSHVTSSVYEPDWEDGMTVKSNVQIQNTGNIDANIRAAIVVTWKVGNDTDGYKTLPEKPVLNTDYTLNIGANWSLNGDYYYYNATVAPDGYTTNLIDKCETIKKYDDGRVLCVEVIGSAIQQQPTGGTTWAIPTK